MDMHTTAVAAVDQSEIAAQLARAVAVFDALDEHREHLAPHHLYDRAYATWQSFVDIDIPLPDEHVATVALRAGIYLAPYEEVLVDLVDVQFGEHEKRIVLDGARGLAWMPADESLILSYPGGDVIFARRRTA